MELPSLGSDTPRKISALKYWALKSTTRNMMFKEVSLYICWVSVLHKLFHFPYFDLKLTARCVPAARHIQTRVPRPHTFAKWGYPLWLTNYRFPPNYANKILICMNYISWSYSPPNDSVILTKKVILAFPHKLCKWGPDLNKLCWMMFTSSQLRNAQVWNCQHQPLWNYSIFSLIMQIRSSFT